MGPDFFSSNSSQGRVEGTAANTVQFIESEKKKYSATCMVTGLNLLASTLMAMSSHFQHTHWVVCPLSLCSSSHTLYPSRLALAAPKKDSGSCLSCPAGDVDSQRLWCGASCGALDSRCGSGNFCQATTLPSLIAGKDQPKPEYPKGLLSWYTGHC